MEFGQQGLDQQQKLKTSVINRQAEWSGCQLLEHDKGINVATPRVVERAGQGSSNVIAQLLPQTHCTLIGGNDQIELHGAKAEPNSLALRMLAHCRSDTFASRFGRHNVAAIADV